MDGLKIIDAHAHAGKYAGSFINTDYEKNLFDVYKKLKIVRGIFTHNSFFFDLEKGLANTLKLIKDYPETAFGYLVYNPHHIDKSLAIINENYGRNNIVGIKMHPEDHQCYITDGRYRPLWDIAESRGIPVLSHTWNPNVASKVQKYADAVLFEKISAEHPKLKIILGHAGAKDYYYFEVIRMLKRCSSSNIYIDTAGDIHYRGMLEHFVTDIGSSQILFGSDAPWIDPSLSISYVMNSAISKDDKENIFFKNAIRLFNLSI
ncbi:MAG: amidohydrolase family protein [Candidatus Humimicrobiaceae bacterium]